MTGASLCPKRLEVPSASFEWCDADSVLAEREKEKDVRVLVHCMTGVSRCVISATIPVHAC